MLERLKLFVESKIIAKYDYSILRGGIKGQIFMQLGIIVLLLSVFVGLTFAFDIKPFGYDTFIGRTKGVILHFLDPGNIQSDISHSEHGVIGQLFLFVVGVAGVAFLSGMLISTLVNAVDRRVRSVELGLVNYRGLNNHYVVIGYSEMTINIINEIFEKHKGKLKVSVSDLRIIIMTNQDVEMVRSNIHSQTTPELESCILIYAGDIESREHLERLSLDRAKEVFVLGEINAYGRDTKNIASLDIIADLRGEGNDLLTVNVQFDRIPSYSIAQKINMPMSYLSPKGSDKPCVNYRPFNFHENWARLMWSYYADSNDGYSPLDVDSSSKNQCALLAEDDQHVHLIIVGFNRMGRALLLEAIRLCHYANYDPSNPNTKTKITVIDMMMSVKKPFFDRQYPYISKQIEDIDIEFIDARVESDEVTKMIDEAAKDKSTILTVAVCIKDPDMSMATGLNLPESVYYQKDYISLDGKFVKENRMRPRVLIRQELHKGLGEILDSDKKRYSNVKIFGMLNRGLCYELLDDRVPMYINKNYELLVEGRKHNSVMAYNEIKASVESGIHSGEAAWLKLAENYRWANRYQVDMFDYYLRVFKQIGLDRVDDIDTKLNGELLESLAKVEHRRWMAERTLSGWRAYDENVDDGRVEEFHIHTLFVPYDQLSDYDQEKDRISIKNVLILHGIFNGRKRE